MILKSISSEPIGLFKNTPLNDGVIRFKTGMNFIFGKKDENSKESLNGIGKSLLLDLIDFCLLASFDSKNIRLFEAKEFLTGYKIVLEFEVDGKNYLIKRSVDSATKADFGSPDNVEEYKTTEVAQRICDLIFYRRDYDGNYSNRWTRKLLPFFLKIHKDKQKKFSDPIDYISRCTALELNQYHLFFLGINNHLASENFKVQTDLREKTGAISQVKEIITSSYKISDINDVNDQIDKLKAELVHNELKMDLFKLEDQYEDASVKANLLTEKIKTIVLKNHLDKERIATYESNLKKFEDKINTRNIKMLYNEMNALLGEKIGKTLDDAIEFRKNLSKSREGFLKKEIDSLSASIESRTEELSKLDQERAKIYEFLKAKQAMNDLSEAYATITRKRDEIAQLESKTKVFFDLSKEKASLKTQEKTIEEQVLDFVEKTKPQVAEYRKFFNKIYEAIYTQAEDRGEAKFRFHADLKKDQKIMIDVVVPAMRSEGKNQGRTLVYDLAVLTHMIEKRFPGPKFLIHDGIFDGVDKAHFVSVCNLINDLAKDGLPVQYLVPLNEEGDLTEKFGKVDQITPENIEKEAIVVLTPAKRLLGSSW